MNKPLSNHTELKERIRALEDSVKSSEEFLVNEGKKALAILAEPGPFIKNLTQELARDKDFRKDLLRIGLSAGVNYLGKMINSPGAGEALISYILKKTNGHGGSGEGGVWKYIARLMEKLKPTKHQQA